MVLKPVDTAIIMVVGPCIDDTDFKTLEESIAYNAAGMDISLITEKTNGTSTTTAITLTTGGTSDWTHKDGGYYEVEITAAQNTEEGVAYLRGVCTGVLPFESPKYEIVKANIYDSLIKGTDTLQTDLIQIGGVVQSLTDFKDMVDTGYDPATHKIQSDLIYIHGTALTETDGQLAAAFKKLFDVATPLLVASTVMRGTDSAYTGTPPTVIQIRTEMDTNSTKMAPSQTLADYKATGFSTHAAADIWSVGTRALTDKSGFGLSAASINLIWDDLISGMTQVGSIGKLIADNLNATITSRAPANEYDTQMGYIPSNLGDVPIKSELDSDHGAGSWATATGFNITTPPTVIAIREEIDSNSTKLDANISTRSSHTAANVWSVVTRSITDKSGFSLSTAGIKAIWDQLTNVLTTVGSAGKLLVDNLNATVSSRNAIAPNTVIPDVAGIAATLHGITDGKIDVMDTIVDAIKAKTDNLPSGITKNEALPKFDLLMVLSSDHITAATGKIVTGEIMKDGNAFAAITNTITEVSNGMYTIADGFTQEEMNADVITLQFSEGTCDTRTLTIVTN